MIYLDHHHAPFSTNLEIPLTYRGQIMYGSEHLHVKGPFGDFLTQRIRCNGLEISLDIFHMDSHQDFYAIPERPVIALVFVLEGSFQMHMSGLDTQVLHAGRYQLVYVPVAADFPFSAEGGVDRIFQVAFSVPVFETLAPTYPGAGALLTHVHERPEQAWQQQTLKITKNCRRIIHTLCHCPDDQEMRKETFLKYWAERLLIEYVRHLPRDPDSWSKSQRQRIQSVMDHLTQHPDLPLSIPALAQQFGLSETTLRTRFARYSGRTLRDFAYEVRMKKAMELLVDGEMAIRDIAYELGYDSQSSFSRAFHRKYGRSPRTYRSS